MAMPELKVGDIVKLKSGGPEMTVASASWTRNDATERVDCQWFDHTALLSGQFAIKSLKRLREISPASEGTTNPS